LLIFGTTLDSILSRVNAFFSTNMGLGRMGQISDISFHTLVSASDNFIRPETLREANNRISNAIAKLPIFRHYDLGDASTPAAMALTKIEPPMLT